MAKKNAQVEEVLVPEMVENTVENTVETAVENTEEGSNTSQGETADNTSPSAISDDTAARLAEHNAKEAKAIADAEFLAEALKIDVGRRIKVVPFNTITWVPGTIVGIVNDKRSHKVLYAIKLDDGRRIVKAHDSELIQKTEETVVIVKNARTAATSVKLSPEEYEKAEAAAAQLVGTTVKYLPFKSESNEKVEGKITSIVPDERSGRILLKIEGLVDGAVKVSHKVSSSPDIELTETVDTEMRDIFLKRREVRLAKLVLTPEQKVKLAEEAVAKAQKAVEVAAENVIKRQAELDAAIEAFLNPTEEVVAEGAVAEEAAENVVYDADKDEEDLS